MFLTLISSLLLTMSATAAQFESETKTTVTLRVQNFECVTSIGSNFVSTRLGNGQRPVMFHNKSVIELEHKSLYQTDCDMPVLNDIYKEASGFFFFLYDVEVTVKKSQAESHRAGNGQCVADYAETVLVNLRPSVVLTSQLVEVRKQTDCK